MYTKPSSVWRPLSASSGHAPSVHIGWPRGQIARITSRFSSKKLLEAYLLIYFQKLAESGCVIPNRESRSMVPRKAKPLTWLVLPFRHSYAGLGGIIDTISKRHDSIRIMPGVFFGCRENLVKLAWTLETKSMLGTLQGFHDWIGDDSHVFQIHSN